MNNTTVNQQLFAQAMAVQEQGRQRHYDAAWAAYEGNPPRPIRVRPGAPDDNVLLNFPAIIVDKGVSYLFGEDLTIHLADDEDGDEGNLPACQTWIDACMKANKYMITLQKLALTGGVTGHVFVKIQAGRVTPQGGGTPYPRFLVLDPATVHPTWDPDDIERVLAFRIQYDTWDEQSGQPIVTRQLITLGDPESPVEQWTITDQVSVAGSNAWRTLRTEVWPWPWCPVLDAQNLPSPHTYWGTSDLEDAVRHITDAINRTMSNRNKIVRIHAHPRTIIKGVGQQQLSQLDTSSDRAMVLQNPDADVKNLEMISDLQAARDLYHDLKDGLYELARIPQVALGKLDSAGPVSGVALQVLYRPLVEKTETKRRTYGDLLERLCAHLLEMGGFDDHREVQLEWPEIIPQDPQAEAQTALLHKQLNVSDHTLQEKLGYDPEVEAQHNAEAGPSAAELAMQAYNRGLPQDGANNPRLAEAT